MKKFGFGLPRALLDGFQAAAEHEKMVGQMKALLPRRATAVEAEQAKERLFEAVFEAAKCGETSVTVPLSDVRMIFFHEKPCPQWKFWRR